METDDTFLEQYIETALWCSVDDSGEPLDGYYTIDDFAPEALEAAKADCEEFKNSANPLLDGLDETQVAHDFWLTRNGHGAGFWDGDYEENVRQQLTTIAYGFGEAYLYIADDQVYYYNG